VSENQDFVPYVPDAATFTDGGTAGRLSGRVSVVTGIYAITTVATKKDGTPRLVNKETGQPVEQTFLRVELTPKDPKDEMDGRPGNEEYLLGDSKYQRASEDGDQILLSKASKGLYRKNDGAKFLALAEKSGLGPMKQASLKAHFLGQEFEFVGVAEPYKDKVTGQDRSSVRLFPSKYVGRSTGVAAAAGAGSAADIETAIDGIILSALAEAPNNTLPVAEIQKRVKAGLPEAQHNIAVKTVFSSAYQQKQGRGFTFASGQAKLAA
jgi:hypothetical protein